MNKEEREKELNRLRATHLKTSNLLKKAEEEFRDIKKRYKQDMEDVNSQAKIIAILFGIFCTAAIIYIIYFLFSI